MKRIPRDPEKFEVIDLFNAIVQKRNLKLRDKDSEKKFIQSISNSLSHNKNIPIILHGRRVQTMFAYVAASLGQCKIIKQEDSRETYADDSNLEIPDYRLVLKEGSEFFVEVKNCHKMDPSSKFSMKKSYLDALQKYAGLFNKELKIAIYWSKWNIWTLVSAHRIKNQGDRYSISFNESFKINEMGTLGDISIGTKPPLTLRIIVDPQKPRTIDQAGKVTFTVGKVELLCCGTLIENEYERHLAFFMMLYGNWPDEEPTPIIENNQLMAVEFLTKPSRENKEQGFDLIGFLSGMISRQFNELTAPDGEIDRLSPIVEPGRLGIIIPSRNHKSQHLPLWLFVLKPNYNV